MKQMIKKALAYLLAFIMTFSLSFTLLPVTALAADAVLDPVSADFDKNPANQADVSTTISWNDATSVTGVTAGGVPIGTENYSFSGDTLTIKKEYLASQTEDELILTVEFNTGNPATLTIDIGDSTPVSAVINPVSATFDKNPANQADVSTTITWNDAATIEDVKTDSVSIETGNYGFSGDTLTIKKEYLASQATGELALTIEFDKGNAATLTVTISDTSLVSAAIDPASAAFDKNPAEQADVSTTITWNSATTVTDIKAGVVSIGTENYSFSEDTLTIKKEYLASQTEDELVLTVEFDTGDPATLIIDFVDSTPVNAVIDPVSATFDRNQANQADVNTAVTWNSATSVTDVTAGGESIGTGNYSYSGDTLTIKKEYLALQADGELILTIEFNVGEPATLTIAVSDTTPVCEIETNQYHLLDEALALIGDGEAKTIKLLTDIEYNAGIVVTGRSITFDLSGHTLNVNNDTGIGLDVGNGGVVDITGNGALNIASSAIGSYGVYAHDGGRVTVNSAAAGDCGFCVYAVGTGSRIEVKGSAVAKGNWSYGVFAVDGGQVSVGGNVRGSFIGVQAGNGSQIEVSGDVVSGEYGYAVIADAGSTISVTGSVIGQNAGVYLSGPGSTAFVGGDVNTGTTGVCLYDGSTATIEGTVTAQTNIILQGVIKDADGEPGDAPYEKYMVYSDGSNTARVNTNAVCWIDATPYKTLGDALASVGSGEVKTIRLITDINYNEGISISGRSITFDLSGHTLNVTSNGGDGLDVGSGGVVDITGGGALNVISGNSSSGGVYAHDGGQAIVTSVTATGENGLGVLAQGSGSRISVIGDVIATGVKSIGVLALGGGHVIVYENVEGSYLGVQTDSGSQVEVSGNVISTGDGYAVMADGMSTVDVTGSVNCQDGIGIYSNLGSTVFVGGSVNSGSTGVCAFDAGTATIEGTITAPTYIVLQGAVKGETDGIPGDAPYGKYLVYTDGSNTVRVNKNAVCWIGVTPYQTLDSALAGVGSGETKTIRLISDIDYNKGIVVTGKTITLNLNGYTLNVVNSTGHGLEAGSGGVVDITGGGAFNIKSSTSYKYGVYAHDGGRAKVTSATATGVSGRGVYAQGTGSRIDVTGNATGNDIGACANSGGRVSIGGDAKGKNAGAEALYSGLVEVSGNVELTGTSGYAIFVYEGGIVKVTGNAGGGNSYGIFAYGAGSIVYVGGNVTAGTGVLMSDGGKATVEGTITAQAYIVLQNAAKTAAEGEPGQAPYEKYLVYTDGNNTVRVNTNAVCWIGSTPYQTLDAALAAIGNGEVKTIRLITDIDYNKGIAITGRTVTFDLSGHTLRVINNEGHGLEVGSGGVVDISENGTFNVTTNAGYYGVYAHDGGRAKVTSATVTMGGCGVYSDGTGSFIEVKVNVSASGIGAYADNGGKVIVGGNVTGGIVGVHVLNGSSAIIEGTITSPTYIRLQGAVKIPTDGVPGDVPYEKYLVYTDGSSIVRVNTNAVCWIGSSPYQTLDAALAAVVSGEAKTIRLISDINYNKGIAISGRSITFDLSGHTLSVVNNTGYGLEVGSGGVVDITESGYLNVTTSSSGRIGVYAHDGGRAKVTNAAATMGGHGVYSHGAGSNIEVTGNSTASGSGGTGAAAVNGGKVSVGVDAEGSYTGVAAIFGGLAEVSGNVKSTGEYGYAVYTSKGGVVRVTGNVSIGNGTGIYVEGSGCAVSVGGDVTAGGTGIQTYCGGQVSVNGTVAAPTYIRLRSESGSIVKTAYDGVPGASEYTGYLVYTDEISKVLVKNPVSPANVDFDRNPANQADVSTTITWNDATSVTDVKAGGISIGTENYSVAGNTLTIRKEYLAPFAPGELVLTVEFNTGAPAKLAVVVRDTTIYTVSLDAAGGSVAPWSMQATYGYAYGDLPVPTKTGYYFFGWYTVAGSRVEKTDIFSFTDNITLHARWIKNALLALSTPSVTAKGTSYNTITLTWKAVKGAEEYQIFRWFDSIKAYDLIDTVDELSYTDTDLEKGVTYYYKIRVRHYPYYDPVDSKFSYTSAKPAWPAIKLTAASDSYNSIKLTWNEIVGAEGYYVYRSTSYKGPFNTSLYTVPKGTGTTISYIDDNNHAGLATGTTYYYEIRAYDGANNSPYSSYKYAKPVWPTISLKAASNTYNSVKLTWNEIAGVEGYKVYRSTKYSGPYGDPIDTVLKGTGTTISYTDDNNELGLNTGTTYYYEIRAYNGTAYSPYCSYKYAKPVWPTINLKAASNTYNSVKLTWNEIAGAEGYKVYRSTKYSGPYGDPIDTVPKGTGTTISYTDDNNEMGLSTGTTYYYEIRAYNGTNNSPYSSYKYAKPAWPTISLKAETYTYNSIKLTWNEIAGAEGYYVYRSASYKGPYNTPLYTVPKGTGTTISYIDDNNHAGLATGTTYYYEIRAYDGANNSPYSSYKYAKPAWQKITLKAVSNGHNSIKLTWNEILRDEDDYYDIFRSTSPYKKYTDYDYIGYIHKGAGTTISYIDTGIDAHGPLVSGKAYYYTIVPNVQIGSSDDYKPGPYCSYAYSTPVPSAPAITLVRKNISISVSWDAVEGASGYAVYRATSLNGDYTLIKTTNKLTHEDTGLYASKYYYYKVRAYTTVGIARVYGPYSGKKYA